MMDKVTIANLGDLVQPFQNSRHLFSAIRGMWQSASSDMAIKENKIIKKKIKKFKSNLFFRRTYINHNKRKSKRKR